MNILKAIGSGLQNTGQAIGTGALAAGKGLADYLNAQAMRQSGLTPEQLQQNPQLARSAMGNWLGSIGQGMQTGDYTGSRLGYQQEMLTKLQNLQAMKQQEQMKQRLAQYQAAMAQADTPEKIAAVGTQFTEFGDLTKNAMAQYQAVSGMKRDTAATKLDEVTAKVRQYEMDNPDVVHTFANPQTGTYWSLLKNNTVKDTTIKVPDEVKSAGDGTGVMWRIPANGSNPTSFGGTPNTGISQEQADTVNAANKAAYVAAGGKDFTPYVVKAGAPISAIDDVRASLGLAISAMSANNRSSSDPSFTYVAPDGTVGVARPGQKLPEGAVSPTQFGSMSMPTAFTKTQVASADTVKQMAEKMKADIAPMMNSLGPVKGRWNELWTTSLGAKYPDFAKFKTNSTLLSSKLMNMHVGSRGGEKMMEHFDQLIGQAKQDPNNLAATLDAIIEYADLVKSHGSSTHAPAGQQSKGKLTDPSVAQRYLQQAGGDKNKARELARKDGWEF